MSATWLMEMEGLVGLQKHDVFEVFVCQLGALLGHDQARMVT